MAKRIVFGIVMSFVLSSLMTCWVTWINLGFIDNFLTLWGKAFLLAWPAAALISITLGPFVQSLTASLFNTTEKGLR